MGRGNRARLLIALILVGVSLWQVSGIVGHEIAPGISNNRAAQPQDAPPVTPQPPQPDGSIIHYVQFGDTLSGIALAYHVSVDEISKLNNLAPNAKVVTGQKLLIKPAPTATAANVTVVVITATNTPGAGTTSTGVAPTAQGTSPGTAASTSNPPTTAPTQPASTFTPSITPTITPTPVPPTPAPTIVPLDQKASVCVTAFEDANANHWQDLGENLLAGVQLNLSQATGSPQTLTTTADNPSCFDGLSTGTYSVNAVPPSGYGLTTPAQLEVDVKAGARLTLTFGAAKGYQPPQADSAATADASANLTDTRASRPGGLLDTLSRNSGLVVLALAGLVLIGGVAVALIARRG